MRRRDLRPFFSVLASLFFPLRLERAAEHGEARLGTASATPRGAQPGLAGGSAWAAGASRPAAPPQIGRAHV